MEAIIALLLAMLGGVLALFCGLLELCIGLFVSISEFLFFLVTGGLQTAREKHQARREANQSKSNNVPPIEPNAAGENTSNAQLPNQVQPDRRKLNGVVSVIVILLIACGYIAWTISDHISQKRIENAEFQMEVLADQLEEQLKDENQADPIPGFMKERDPWRQPYQLFVDNMTAGSLIVVRSAGPDRTHETVDDLLEIRVVPKDAKEIGGELINRGLDVLKERMNRFMK
ncbi:hypothetical protein [Calycomorphotria hydatis]|uniref:Uncharacterized protein n=1 Tax=Calycomorphotria hydatis TaxID=2528027 RepID=A0A517T5Y9_9PLAN|nr:hypothetical protein [Calycomorphotria hydatis]QDT63778.1 hypothetical protein V22_10030 [Calycomorphotria hydatis]